jgi:hypothetical protein
MPSEGPLAHALLNYKAALPDSSIPFTKSPRKKYIGISSAIFFIPNC